MLPQIVKIKTSSSAKSKVFLEHFRHKKIAKREKNTTQFKSRVKRIWNAITLSWHARALHSEYVKQKLYPEMGMEKGQDLVQCCHSQQGKVSFEFVYTVFDASNWKNGKFECSLGNPKCLVALQSLIRNLLIPNNVQLPEPRSKWGTHNLGSLVSPWSWLVAMEHRT